jgi:hypothetical protein
MDNNGSAPPSLGPRPYKYEPLDATEEIRLIEILPGQFIDKLRIEIHQAPLQAPERSPTQRLRINELRETLPESWQVYETIDHDYLFGTAARKTLIVPYMHLRRTTRDQASSLSMRRSHTHGETKCLKRRFG